ncbi:site-specific integrase [Lentibacillus kapialis]|uniref:Site-specific integrase n=1 Tax=Lentibacillus kapialis TaxID=340214 RepID=A0A917PPK1_9BACI|nr:site-specific integrase [Lentibacillus kapialis]GGJ86338.1 site-specific integrase [Lentibacillus kapialis]
MQGGVRKRYGSWYYYFDLSTVDGKRKRIERKTSASTKTEAEKVLRKKLAEYDNEGVFFEPSDTSVHDYFQFWIEEYVEINLKYYTVMNYKGIVKNHINPALGDLKLRSLTPETLQKFINDKHRAGFKHRTLSLIRAVLQRSLKQAVFPYQLLKDNPMQYVELPRQEQRKPTRDDLKILDMQSIKKITSHLTEDNTLYLPFHIGLNTGARSGEVCALKWSSVDLNKGMIKIDSTMVDHGGRWDVDSPKTASSYRDIKIGDTLINILKRHKTWQKQNKLKYGEFYFDSDFVCTKENGQFITPTHIKYYVKKMNKQLGINMHFHGLRHTHATLLLEQGAPVKDIQKRLGHKKTSLTLDTYSHLTEKMSNQTVDIFENLMNE